MRLRPSLKEDSTVNSEVVRFTYFDTTDLQPGRSSVEAEVRSCFRKSRSRDIAACLGGGGGERG